MVSKIHVRAQLRLIIHHARIVNIEEELRGFIGSERVDALHLLWQQLEAVDTEILTSPPETRTRGFFGQVVLR